MLPAPFTRLAASALTSASLSNGDTLFRQGDRPLCIYWLEAGNVLLRRHSRSGQEIIIHRANPGEIFAEAALFSSAYHCDAVCTKDALLTRIDKAAVLEAMRTDPDFALALSARFAGQIQSYRRRIELLAVASAEERVCSAVADGLLDGNIKTFAAEIGLSHEATYRALGKLAKSGKLLKTGRGAYAAP